MRLFGDEREQELEALDLALMGIEAALDRLPGRSGWIATLRECGDALASVVRKQEEA